MIAAPILAAIALSLTGHSTEITCEGRGYLQGWAFPGQPRVWLTEPVCTLARQGRGVGVRALLHELAHTLQTVGDEHGADCYARDHLRGVLKRFWRFKTHRVNTEYQEALAAEREGAREDARYGCVR